MDVVIEADVQFFGGLGKGHECVPSASAVIAASAVADFAFANASASSQFGGVIVQGDIGMVQDHEQSLLFGKGKGKTFIEKPIGGFLSEDALELGSEMCFLLRRG